MEVSVIRKNFLVSMTWQPEHERNRTHDMCLWTGTINEWFVFAADEPEHWKTESFTHVTDEEAAEIAAGGYIDVFSPSQGEVVQ
jgi:hypothetical protein